MAFHHARRGAQGVDQNLSETLVPAAQQAAAAPAVAPTRSLFQRSAELFSRSNKCTTSSEADTCQKPTDSSLAIILAAVIPIVVAIVVLFILHQRHMKKQRLEDLNDKHKSLDFGLDEPMPASGRAGRKHPEMSVADAEKTIRKGGRGMSMDMSNSPYLMPDNVRGSRESLHSMNPSIVADSIDPYRPVTFIKEADNASMMSKSNPFSSPEDPKMPEIQFPPPSHVKPPPSPSAITPQSGSSPADKDLTRDSYFENNPAKPAETPFADPVEPTLPEIHEAMDSAEPLPTPTPRKPTPLRLESMVASVHNPQTDTVYSKTSDYGDGFKVTPPSPGREESAATAAALESQGLNAAAPKPGNRISMSLRPLPPMEDPTENPEERANRIRSFYKEYFDDSKPEPQGRLAENEGYDQEYMEGAIFDPDKGHFVVGGQPFAEPVTRRAMTPPPRAPPRFRGNAGHAYSGSGGASGSGRFTPMSMPRGNSAMSMRSESPKKPLPPPSVLNSLPTPAKLTDDALTLNPADFAPPPSFREMQNGRRPDSPMGMERPYSPSVRPHTPLISAFDEMPVIPSPHALRKSGTFTSLDFVPPPRFKDVNAGSDAASIRSNGTGISAQQMQAVRNGAYRVSRLPAQAVGTKDDMMSALKPSWDLRDGGNGQVKPSS
ncbi:uncharacterized protein K452DRAFT_326432 [Aplosporella prunicola CBS 121167]|uniref:Uncharacterized protein n=1 Tax=Aplosporella prunicola CBS 121167 TaxID=1176127 RepID=A0A6A6BEF9_9PEZI|nr:uncharacterized protein K452DRAFT_326432 [Aplosporella prunicola CBS 121167]KAF2142549.1 hypothetical protein K452DRAFT_326432 [Aplosporella prunicola CBS 121167]